METFLEANGIRVSDKLGEGKAGVVWLGALTQWKYGLSPGTEVAVKRYKPWILELSGQSERIKRELVSGLSMRSLNVVRTYELLSSEADTYLVMEAIPGPTLTKCLEDKDWPGSVEALLSFCRGLLAGIRDLHASNLVHRDIKPDNIKVAQRGPVILDLGVARDLQATKSITGDQFLGTIVYAAPEYLFKQVCGPPVDLYSFGAILYELIRERPLHDGYWSEVIVEKHRFTNRECEASLWPGAWRKYGFVPGRFLMAVAIASLAKHDERPEASELMHMLDERRWLRPFTLAYDRPEPGRGWFEVSELTRESLARYARTSDLCWMSNDCVPLIWSILAEPYGVEWNWSQSRLRELYMELHSQGLVFVDRDEEDPESHRSTATDLLHQLAGAGVFGDPDDDELLDRMEDRAFELARRQPN